MFKCELVKQLILLLMLRFCNLPLKVQERAASLEHCPWCTSKGLTCALRSYHINLQESITLCTNPQCLFPLVSRSLEDVLASLEPVEPTVGNKRKNGPALEEEEELIIPAHKRLRSSESITDTQAERGAENVVSNGQHAAPGTDGEKVDGYHRDSPETTERESPQDEEDVVDKEAENVACTNVVAPPTCSATAGHLQRSPNAALTPDGRESELSPRRGAPGISEAADDLRQVQSLPEVLHRRCPDSNQSSVTNEGVQSAEINTPSPQHDEQTARTGRKSPTADIDTCKETEGIKEGTEDLSATTVAESEELVPVPSQLFWRNSDSLCWLDSLLVALVNCKSLRRNKPKDEPQQSSVWRLMRGYEDICAAVQVHQQTGRDGVVRVPNHVLQKANADLQSLRMSVFTLLQPKLQCKLGKRETPVFALPLLLTMDPWAEPLFQSTFHWEFKCSDCKAATKERAVKTLPTFTNILPDWCPLHAAHWAPCNSCCKKNQRRTMMLERVPPVFALHFVDGLPDNDVRIYTFTFKGKRYSVTTVIQYNQQLKHFVSWVSNSDGSWLEYDDLNHPECKTHQKLPVPAQEMHLVFWEAEEDKEPRVCSPSTTFNESPPSKTEINPSLVDKDLTADELSHNDSDIICALSASEDCSGIMDTTVTAAVDTSIGSTTLLNTFEGLSHNDIITLTLVELNADSEMPPLNDDSQTVILDSTPDSSSAVTGSEKPPDVGLPTPSNSSESDDGSSSDPTFVPGARGGRGRGRGVGRGRTVGRQVGKKAASSKAVPHTSPSASSEPSEVISDKPVDSPPAETQQASPVSSTDTSSLSTSQKNPSPVPATPDQHARWSFLLSKHPLNPVQKSTAPTPVAHVQPAPPAHSTPNPVRRPQPPGGLFPKPQLKTEESGGLPLKAAEMYGAFGAKSSNTPSPLPSAAPLTSKLVQPVTSKLLTNSTVVSGTSLPVPGAKTLPEISSSKKHSSKSSKLPPGLSETEVLRYKLKKKLIKKLKEKKKKLAQLNEMLGHPGGARLRPDSTDLGSPNTVTSSTYDGSICDDFLSDLLSPATTASNLSPDSSGFLEMLAGGQDGADQLDSGARAASQVNICAAEPHSENFLEDFLSQAVAQRPTEMETEALSELFFV